MALLQTTPTAGVAEVSIATVMDEFVRGIVAALPRVLSAVVFLTIAYLAIKVILAVVRTVFGRLYPADQELVVDLFVMIVALFLWFGAGLALLGIVGLEEVAASMGTAAGFIGLGVAFALKEMIADTVAGVYLLRDPDFNVGYTVNTASVTGTITRIDLRKSRLETPEGDLVVLANRDVEKKWTKEAEETTAEPDA